MTKLYEPYRAQRVKITRDEYERLDVDIRMYDDNGCIMQIITVDCDMIEIGPDIRTRRD